MDGLSLIASDDAVGATQESFDDESGADADGRSPPAPDHRVYCGPALAAKTLALQILIHLAGNLFDVDAAIGEILGSAIDGGVDGCGDELIDAAAAEGHSE